MEWAQLPFVQLGAVGLLFAVGWLVFLGRLVPRSVLEDVRADRDARVAEIRAEATEYKEAWLASEDARREQDRQFDELMELARTTDQAIRSLASHGGSRDVVAP